jgi:four helix bundle protein
MGTYRDLDVYQRSFNVAIEIYHFTLTLPKYLQFDIADDVRRAARSVPSNIAEGYGRNKSNADKKNFLKTSLGSADEVLFNLDFVLQLQLISNEKHANFIKEYKIICAELFNLISSLQ